VTCTVSLATAAVRRLAPMSIPVGAQILAGANRQALAAVATAGGQFVRAEGFVFAHVGDEGWSEACAGPLLRYRRAIDADDVLVLADIKKKHSSHALTSDLSVAETAQAADFFMADGVILTGGATGQEANAHDLKEVTKAVPQMPVLVGSGLTPDNVHKFGQAHGLIVGSYFKRDGHWRNELDPRRIESMAEAVCKLRREIKPA
jgi:membrane complex biogenesis BtpA family protein